MCIYIITDFLGRYLTVFIFLPAALMSAAIFGNFSSIMMRMYQGSEEMQQKTRSITDFIKFHSMPKTLSKRMHDAFLHSWSDTNGVDMNSVSLIYYFDTISKCFIMAVLFCSCLMSLFSNVLSFYPQVLKSFPEQIQADICLHLNKNLLNNNIAFKGASPGCLR